MKELSSSVKLDGIYGDEVTIETAETIEEIMKIRKRIIENGWKWKNKMEFMEIMEMETQAPEAHVHLIALCAAML